MRQPEEWVPVSGYEPYYEVSSDGRVRSIRRGRLLKPFTNKLGYQFVDLKAPIPGRKMARVHRLVCEAFHGPAPEGKPNVLHGDGDPANNRRENLRWGSQKDNSADTLRHGRNPNTKKTYCRNGHAFDQVNTYITATGGRSCRACRRKRSKEGLCEGDTRHGTLTAYSSYGCRCEQCKQAHRNYHQSKKENNK